MSNSNLQIDAIAGTGNVSTLTPPLVAEIGAARAFANVGEMSKTGLKMAGLFMVARSRVALGLLPRKGRKSIEDVITETQDFIGKSFVSKSDLKRKGVCDWVLAGAPQTECPMTTVVSSWLVRDDDEKITGILLNANGTDGLASFGQLRTLYKSLAPAKFTDTRGATEKAPETDAETVNKAVAKAIDGATLEGTLGALGAAIAALESRMAGAKTDRNDDELKDIATALNSAATKLATYGEALMPASAKRENVGPANKAPADKAPADKVA